MFGMFGLMQIIFPVMFLLVFGIVLGTLIQNIKRNRKNDNSPRISAPASVLTKRTQVRGDHAHTWYYATFQFESGDRLELEIPHDRFGYLVEGDKGKLTFQGTRFLEFERQ